MPQKNHISVLNLTPKRENHLELPPDVKQIDRKIAIMPKGEEEPKASDYLNLTNPPLSGGGFCPPNYMKNFNMKHKITFILSLLVLLNSTVGYSYQGEVFTLSSLTATEKKSAKAIWNIITPTGSGTGFFISKNELVTNFHIVDHLTQYNIKKSYLIQEGHSRTLKIKQIKHLSAQHDLAVLEIKDEVSDYLKISEEIPQPDEDLFSIGYPAGQFSIIKKTSDIFSFDESNYSFFSDHTNLPGASGSPLLNLKGEVVGVLSGGGNNEADAIKAIRLKNLLSEEIKSFENPEDHVAHTIEQLKKAANQGNKGAQFRLGFYYHQGDGVKQDYKEAVYWYEQAAKQGHAWAQTNLGTMYEKGQGVAQDYKAAMQWLSKAAEQGLAGAQFNIGNMHYKGQGVAQDYKAAVQWWRKVAEQGDAKAQLNLGVMYGTGQGVAQDNIRAYMWANLAVSNGAGTGLRGLIAEEMTSADIEKAQSLARDCLESNYKDC